MPLRKPIGIMTIQKSKMAIEKVCVYILYTYIYLDVIYIVDSATGNGSRHTALKC